MAKPGPKPKSLAQLVSDGTFLARRHAHLLEGPDVPQIAFVKLQRHYRTAPTPRAKRGIALEFEKRCRFWRSMREAQGDEATAAPERCVQ